MAPFFTLCFNTNFYPFNPIFGILFLIPTFPLCAFSQGKNYRFTHYKEESIIQTGIGDVMFDQAGFLWLSTQTGIVRFDGNEFREYSKFSTKEITCNRFKGMTNEGYIRGEDGSLYTITNKHSVQRLSKAQKDAYFKNKPKDKINAIFEWNKIGNYLFYNDLRPGKMKLMLFSDHGEVQQPASVFFGDLEPAAIKNTPTFMYRSKSGYFFLLNGSDLYSINTSNDKLEAKLIFSDLNISGIAVIDYYPLSQVYAFGSFSHGLTIVKENPFRQIPSTKYGRVPVSYSSIPLDRNQILLSNGDFYQLESGMTTQGLNLTYTSFAFLLDSEKHVWYTDLETLYCKDLLIRTIHSVNLKQSGIFRGAVHRIMEDQSQTIWFNTGLHLFAIRKGCKTPEKFPYFTSNADEYIETFDFLNSRILWVATSKRLVSIDIETGEKRILLSGMDVRSIYEDRNKNVWVGTYGNGVFLLHHNRLTKVPMDDKNHLIYSHGFILDKNNILWISTNRGLFAVSKQKILNAIRQGKKSISYLRYSTEDGLPVNEFNGGCYPACYEYKDNLYFSSMKGLISFSPDITYVKKHPTIELDEISCDDQILPDQQIELAPDFGHLSIDFSIPNWGKKSDLEIFYKIDGSTKPQWLELNTGEKLHITNLPSGRYTITLRVDDALGIYHTYKQINFSVNPFYHQIIALRFFALVVLISGVMLLYWLRLNFLIRKRKRLLKQVKQQVEELNESNQNLKCSLFKLNETKNKLEISNNIRAKLVSIFIHDLKSPMYFLSKVTQKISENENAMNKEEFRELTGDLHNYSKSIIQYIDHFLIWQTVNQNNWIMNPEKVRLETLIQEVTDSYRDMCKKNDNVIVMHCPASLSVSTDPELLKIILRNLVDNANKHTNSGKITVEALEKNERVNIIVSDTGQGLSKKTIERLYAAMKQNQLGKSHRHIGYQIIGDLIKVLHAEIYIRSTGNGLGTQIELAL